MKIIVLVGALVAVIATAVTLIIKKRQG